MEDGAGTPGHADIPSLEHLERDDRRVGQVSQFVSEEAEALASARGFFINPGLISFARVLSDRARDSFVQAAVQHPEVVGADGRVQFHGELGDRLTDVAIAVHDL